MADPPSDQPTAASILRALLLTPTHFLLHPTLSSLRATLDESDPRLSRATDDAHLKLALREIARYRRGTVEEVEGRIGRYKLLPKERRERAIEPESDEEPGGERPDALPLAEVMELLAAEEARLSAELEEAEVELQRTKAELEA